jgi:hypothetical protein
MTFFDSHVANKPPVPMMRLTCVIAKSAKTVVPFLGGQPLPKKGREVLVANLNRLTRVSKTPVKGCDGKRLYAVEFWERD